MVSILERQELYKESFEKNRAQTRGLPPQDLSANEESKSKMSVFDLLLYLFIALIFDLLSLIPGLGSAVGPLGIGILSFLFWLKGIKGFSTTAFLGVIIEAIPVIEMLPACIAFVVRTYFLAKAKETTSGALETITTT